MYTCSSLSLKKSPNSHIIIPAYGDRGALWLGDFVSSKDEVKYRTIQAVLILNKISTVITVATKLPNVYSNITHIKYEIDDKISTDISKFFLKCCEDIDDGLNRGGVLGINQNQQVHCAAGISRSATIVIAYLMIQRKLSLIDALQFVKRQRPCVSPNDGFMKQLEILEQHTNTNFRLKENYTDMYV